MVGDKQTVDQANAKASDLVHNVSGKFSLADRAHALQDKAAPWHSGQGWNDSTTLSDKALHLAKDLFPFKNVMDSAFRNTDDLLKGKYNNYCPIK